MVVMRLVGVVLLLLVAGCGASPSAAPTSSSAAVAPSSAPASFSGPAVADCGSFTLHPGEEMPESPVTCFVDAHRAKRAARLERTAPSVEGYRVREEYVTDHTGLIGVTIDMSQDPYGGFRIERKICAGVAVVAPGYLDFVRCKLR